LARQRGCLLCHAFQPDDSAVAKVLPPAPTFREIAKRYKGVKDADKQLVETVLQGTGPHPGDRHWAGKVNAPDRMLPNAVEIEPHEARTLVHWILALDR
jgi:cytochrome c